MLLLDPNDPWLLPVRDACAAYAGANAKAEILAVHSIYRGRWAIGSVGDDDALDDPIDPAIDRSALASAIAARGIAAREAELLALCVAQRENVIDASAERGVAANVWSPSERPPTLFEHAALADVIGADLAGLLPVDRVAIDRAPLEGAALNHCQMGSDGVAHIRLLSTNGTTLAGRAHALVHEMGHALIGVARTRGKSYGCAYGQPDYARFFAPSSFGGLCDEEALVRAIADAWLLKRSAVTWARTWPGAVDDAAKDLEADELAAFARFRLAQGLGLDFVAVAPRKLGARSGDTRIA